MRAVTAWLESANAAAYAEAKPGLESGYVSQPQGSGTNQAPTSPATTTQGSVAAAPSGSEGAAGRATPPTAGRAGLARGFLNSRVSVESPHARPSELPASPQSAPQTQQEYEAMVAAMTESLQQQQQQQVVSSKGKESVAGFAALAGVGPVGDQATDPVAGTAASSPAVANVAEQADDSAADDVSEADEFDVSAADAAAEQLAAAERQRIVDEAVETLFDASFSDQSGLSEADILQQGHAGDQDPEQGSYSPHGSDTSASCSTSASTSASATDSEDKVNMADTIASSGEAEEEDRLLELLEAKHVQEAEDNEEEAEAEANRGLAEVLDTVGSQGYGGLQAALQSVLQLPQRNPAAEEHAAAAGRDTATVAVSGHCREEVATPAGTSGGVVETRPGQSSPMPGGSNPGVPSIQGQLADRGSALNTQAARGQPRGLPPLSARGRSTAQQGTAAVSHESVRSSPRETLLSQDQLQMLVDEIFKVGYETMGQLYSGSSADLPLAAAHPAAGSASGAPAGSASGLASAADAAGGHAETPPRSHDGLQCAFNQVVSNSLQQQPQPKTHADESTGLTETSTEGAAAHAMAAADAATAHSAALSTTPSAAPSAATSTQLQRDQDDLPRRLIARERKQVRREEGRGQLPRHHSVFSAQDNHHVSAITEQTECVRQVGFGTQMRRRHAWIKPLVKGLFRVALGMALGFASGKIHQHQASKVSEENESPSDPESTDDFDMDDFYMRNWF